MVVGGYAIQYWSTSHEDDCSLYNLHHLATWKGVQTVDEAGVGKDGYYEPLGVGRAGLCWVCAF
jgi:hypothetical protein